MRSYSTIRRCAIRFTSVWTMFLLLPQAVLVATGQQAAEQQQATQQQAGSAPPVGAAGSSSSESVVAKDSLPDAPVPQSQAPQQTPSPGQQQPASQDQPPPALPQQASQQNQQQPPPLPQQPVGTAAAPAAKPSGIPGSMPSGAAIAPAKQRRVRAFVISIGIALAGAAAIGTVVGLSKASHSTP